MSSRIPRGSWTLVAIASAAGAIVAVVLGFLTFGAQASVSPEQVPVAVAAPDAGPARAAADRLAAQTGDALSWQSTTLTESDRLLHDKQVYGVLELTPGPGGTVAKVVVSGAINPSGTQVAQQALTAAGQALSAGSPVQVETLHPASMAGRSAPLGVSALAWIGCLVGGAALTLLADRAGRKPSAWARLSQVAGVSVLVTAVLAGFLKLWDSTLPLGWDVLGFLFLSTAALAALQGGLLRMLGLRAMAILTPLYLIAPAVAGQVPELLHPGYRAALWSWTPFRFSTEGLRSLLQGTPDAPDVLTGVWVFGGLLLVSLVVLLWPGWATAPTRLVGSSGKETESHSANGVVQVGVH
ncbi:hypothetical protein [Amycolatopsis nigrescens]|uniref:hypothetical protein n=1 Tax=Amycolatopsis nigrescens TaxID=381445 RepID=UPI00036B4C56|nr:hypothetical protein [Amycolatopsis nigrescens]